MHFVFVIILRLGKYDLLFLIRPELANASWLIQFSKIFCLLNTRRCIKCAEQVVDTAEDSLF